MSDDEKIKQIKSNLSEYALRELNLANFSSQEERRFHDYIKGICQRLLGDTLDLENQNIIFALSDKPGVNAAHVSHGNMSIIYLTEGLLDLCKNEDQLAFILGHELGHYEERLRQGANKVNSKAEETACDLRAIQKMARGGYNLEEACNIAAALFNNPNIQIEDLKDPHTNDISRVNLINAMKKKEKDRIIEEQNIEITQSTPLPSDILEMVYNRTRRPPLYNVLSLQMQSVENQNPDEADEKKIALWFRAFHENIIFHNHSYAMTKDDSLALSRCLNELLRNENMSDKFLSTVFAEMESLKDKDNFAAYVNIMHGILNEIYSYDNLSHAKIDADKKDCLTAMWLKRYLHGFREASGDRFNKMIQNLEYVKQFVARHYFDNYRGILVKNFNLLELEFNENDIGKKFSPQILKHIRSYINAKDKFVTFDGLVIHPMGDALILTHEKNNWSLFVDSSGEIKFSFPAQDLAKMQLVLMKQVIENAQKRLEMAAHGEITDFAARLKCLHEAHRILLPVSRQNDLKNILEIRNKTKDTKDILMSDVMAVLSPEAAQFFSERTAETKDNQVYTNQITNLYADMIRTAPKEHYQEIFDALTLTHIHQRLSGEDKLVQAFLDNPVFFEELEKTIKSYEPFPKESKGWGGTELFQLPDSDTRCNLLNLLSKIGEITEFKLFEHLENGGNFDNFEQPFKNDLARLFGFAPQGDIDETLAIQHLKRTRNSYKEKYRTLYEEAYMIYSSYDALRSDTTSSAELLMGFNVAGYDLKRQANILNESIKRAQKDYIDNDEKHQMQERRQHFLAVADKIHHSLTERIQQAVESKKLSIHDIFYMVLNNDKIGDETYGSKGFETIVSNLDFEKNILSAVTQGDDHQIHSAILSLEYLAKYYESTKEQDAFKEKTWPSIAIMFQRDGISLSRKVEYFQMMAKYNLFPSDYKRYYETLIGKDGQSGLLSEIKKSDNLALQFDTYTQLLDKNARIPDPEIRSDIIKHAAYAFWQINGSYNDITAAENEREAIIKAINELKESDIAPLDKIEILKEISELTMSQRELSLAIEPHNTSLQVSDSRAIQAAYGLDTMAYSLQNFPETKVLMQDFLLGDGSLEEASELVENIRISLCKEHDKHRSPKILDRYLNGEDIFVDLEAWDYRAKDYYNKLTPQSCLHFKMEFDAAPLEIKALIVNEFITNGKADWEETFKIVSEKLFTGAGQLGKIGSDFLHSYIAARPQSEKTFYLAAMMAAANNKNKTSENYVKGPYSSEERSLAKGLRLFLESSGPAGIKLAQAMASYSEVPAFIRHEMQFAKSEANPPARWEIFSGQEEIMDKLLSFGPLGKRRGSASFFVTYDLGDKIVKIMRRGAKIKADAEFAIYAEMLQTLSSNYQNLSSFQRLVQNAADNVHIETDLKIGEKQYRYAKKLYPDAVTANNITFGIKVMDWIERSQSWAIMDKAQGVDFKDLKEPYKTAAAKAVFSTELANMLSGKRFDSDRHGGQYKFDTQNNIIGVFDTGSVSMVEPTQKEREILGIVLARTLKALRRNPDTAAVFSAEIDKASNEFYGAAIARGLPIPPYLSEFQRGMLALNDFYSSLSGKDVAECIIKALDNGHHKIHPQIVKAFQSEIKKSLERHNVTIQDLLIPENSDNLIPEARANRRRGKILFNAVFQSISEGKNIDLSSESSQKLFSHLQNSDVDLQIVKGVVRGAYEKLDPRNYTQTDREELGMFLYEICRTDINNQRLKKAEAFEEIIARTLQKSPKAGTYTRNIMKLVAVMTKIPALNTDQLKKAAVFIAFADKDVARGFKHALKEDKSIGFAKRMMLKMAPMDFIPRNAKKMLIRAVTKRFVSKYLSEKIFGTSTGLPKTSDRNTAQR